MGCHALGKKIGRGLSSEGRQTNKIEKDIIPTQKFQQINIIFNGTLTEGSAVRTGEREKLRKGPSRGPA
jgi:hypothetical protein